MCDNDQHWAIFIINLFIQQTTTHCQLCVSIMVCLGSSLLLYVTWTIYSIHSSWKNFENEGAKLITVCPAQKTFKFLHLASKTLGYLAGPYPSPAIRSYIQFLGCTNILSWLWVFIHIVMLEFSFPFFTRWANCYRFCISQIKLFLFWQDLSEVTISRVAFPPTDVSSIQSLLFLFETACLNVFC